MVSSLRYSHLRPFLPRFPSSLSPFLPPRRTNLSPPLSKQAFFICCCGIVSASASITVYNLDSADALWSPFDIMNQWESRAAIAFAAMAWMLAGIAANITANSISSANDLVTLFPKWVDITRGQLITAVIGGWATAPWAILASSGACVLSSCPLSPFSLD
jgi:cytosine/uracil/thiamine/allantoin permease